MAARSVILRAAVGALLVLVATASRPACAQPSSIRNLASRPSLDQGDLDKIEEYVRYWAGELNDAIKVERDEPVDVRPIRQKLLEPIRSGASEVFRDAFGRAALPLLEPAVKSGNGQESVTAVIVISLFGTERSLDMLVNHSAKSNEPRHHVRLAAARGCALTINRAGESIASKDVVAAARGIAAAAVEEDDPFTLRHQVDALLASLEKADGATSRDKVTDSLVAAIQATAERAKSAPDPDDALAFLNAVYPVMNKLRGRFFALQEVGGAKKAFGISFGPCLENVLAVAEARWPELQDGKSEKDRLGNIIQLCETFLGAIDVVVRAQASPNTRLKQAWADGDRDRYRRDLNTWRSILTQPPY